MINAMMMIEFVRQWACLRYYVSVNGYDNRKTSFAGGFSSGFVLKDIKMMITGLFPRPIKKKTPTFFSMWLFAWLETVSLWKLFLFFRRYSCMQVQYFMQSYILGAQQDKSAPHPRSMVMCFSQSIGIFSCCFFALMKHPKSDFRKTC